MKLTLDCPKARYDERMRIVCKAADGLCGHQRFKPCVGWCVLTEQAGRCPLRKGDEHGKEPETAAHGGD